jgi:hypothetical protein
MLYLPALRLVIFDLSLSARLGNILPIAGILLPWVRIFSGIDDPNSCGPTRTGIASSVTIVSMSRSTMMAFASLIANTGPASGSGLRSGSVRS